MRTSDQEGTGVDARCDGPDGRISGRLEDDRLFLLDGQHQVLCNPGQVGAALSGVIWSFRYRLAMFTASAFISPFTR